MTPGFSLAAFCTSSLFLLRRFVARRPVQVAKKILQCPVNLDINIDRDMDGFDFHWSDIHLAFCFHLMAGASREKNEQKGYR